METTATGWAIRIRAADGSGERLAGKFESIEQIHCQSLYNARKAVYATRQIARTMAGRLRASGIHATPVKVSIEITEVL